MALQAAKLDDDGLAIWEKWSRKSDKFPRGRVWQKVARV